MTESMDSMITGAYIPEIDGLVVSGEPLHPEDYASLVTALEEAELAARRIVSAYDVSLARFRECRFESEAALAILVHSNRNAELTGNAGSI